MIKWAGISIKNNIVIIIYLNKYEKESWINEKLLVIAIKLDLV
jgi:hypothetical protein